MRKPINLLRNDKKGNRGIEYGLLVSLIVIAVVGAFVTFGCPIPAKGSHALLVSRYQESLPSSLELDLKSSSN
jgi:Flp pilus assembly pilin Flp